MSLVRQLNSTAREAWQTTEVWRLDVFHYVQAKQFPLTVSCIWYLLAYKVMTKSDDSLFFVVVCMFTLRCKLLASDYRIETLAWQRELQIWITSKNTINTAIVKEQGSLACIVYTQVTGWLKLGWPCHLDINIQQEPQTHTVSKQSNPVLSTTHTMLSVTLSFVTRNLLAPEIVCEHWGPGITPSPSPYQLSEMWWRLKNGDGGGGGGAAVGVDWGWIASMQCMI